MMLEIEMVSARKSRGEAAISDGRHDRRRRHMRGAAESRVSTS